MQDLTVTLSFLYPQCGTPMKVEILESQSKKEADLLETDFTYGFSMLNGTLFCIRKWKLTSDETPHRFGFLNDYSETDLLEFDNKGSPLMRLAAPNCRLMATVTDAHGNNHGEFSFDLGNFQQIATKEISEIVELGDGKTMEFKQSFLPFPENKLGLIGIRFKAPEPAQDQVLAAVGSIKIEKEAANFYARKHEIHPNWS